MHHEGVESLLESVVVAAQQCFLKGVRLLVLCFEEVVGLLVGVGLLVVVEAAHHRVHHEEVVGL